MESNASAAMTTLRPAKATDAPSIVEILVSTRVAFMPYAPLAHSCDDMLEWVSTHLIPNGGVTVAERSGELVGVLATSCAQGVSWIDQLYVQPASVGQGVGALLLTHAHRQLARPIQLYTFQVNSGARRFYERYGYRVLALSDGQVNEEKCPDVLYELA